MIRYALICDGEHEFDAWFRDSRSCDEQLTAGLASCPVCGSVSVAKALMAPNVVTGRSREAHQARAEAVAREMLAAHERDQQAGGVASRGVGGGRGGVSAPANDSAPAGTVSVSSGSTSGGVPDRVPSAEASALMSKLAEAIGTLRKHVEETCEYVGETFAEESRRIHYGEAEERPIYGEATLDEAKALDEEGIAVAALPWRGRTDS